MGGAFTGGWTSTFAVTNSIIPATWNGTDLALTYATRRQPGRQPANPCRRLNLLRSISTAGHRRAVVGAAVDAAVVHGEEAAPLGKRMTSRSPDADCRRIGFPVAVPRLNPTGTAGARRSCPKTSRSRRRRPRGTWGRKRRRTACRRSRTSRCRCRRRSLPRPDRARSPTNADGSHDRGVSWSEDRLRRLGQGSVRRSRRPRPSPAPPPSRSRARRWPPSPASHGRATHSSTCACSARRQVLS